MSKSQPPAFEELKSHLRDMFQLDRGDLDFGIYRVMNIKRTEVGEFLDNCLLPQVHEILEEYSSSNKSDLQEELERTIKNLEDAGAEVDTVPKVIDLRAKIAAEFDPDKIATEIYSDLYNFFKRYYSEGDFMSLRRYKEGVYALPYEGEEVKLHWANHDQYYIKTGENLKHYTFKVDDGRRVRFEITAATTEINNNKAAKGKERRFLLAEEERVSVDGDQLTIRFEFRPDDANRKQDDINKATRDSLLTKPECVAFGLNKPDPNNQERTLLEKHLTTYTAKFTFDYFIHKDLGGFLRRELDFFIKNEIMHLDDIENDSAPKAENYLAKIKAMRGVGHKIIDFLAQLEEFQKKLWLKKKFVLETHYCITLDHIIGSEAEDELLQTVAANDAQREEWVQLFAIDEVEGYTTPLTVDFLRANDKLQVDTRFFDADFKYTLLSLFDDLDEVTNGVLIDSENFQALNLLQDRYREQIKCIYIDPPYNAKSSEILYKNTYKHSSWLSLMNDRIVLSKSLLSPDFGVLSCAIDENEQDYLSVNFRNIFPDSIYEKNCLSVRHNTKGIQGGYVSINNEYCLVVSPNGLKSYEVQIPEEERKYDNFRNWGGESERNTAKNCFYPIYVRDGQIEGFGEVCPEEYHPTHNEPHDDGMVAVYPVDSDGVERKWTYARQSVENIVKLLKVEKLKNGNWEIKKCRDTQRFKTFWDDKRYIAGDYGSKPLNKMFDEKRFDFPKSICTVFDALKMSSNEEDTILDYFAGSGTTAHAVIDLNREDGGDRKYILVEMGEYFSTVTKPRVQKAAYSSKWKDGKPDERDGVSQVIKYLSLEQYEDTLDNLRMKLDKGQASFLYDNPQAREEFMLGYMMDVESAGSASLLNIDYFANPFDYRLKISRDDESKDMPIDLIETFNYLLGLNVKRIRHFDNGIIAIEGSTPSDENVSVVWRDTNMIDGDTLNAWFAKTYRSNSPEAKVIYVNGDNSLANIKPEGQKWDVRLTEAEFKRRMFDVGDV